MQTIILENKVFVIKIVSTIDKIDAFIYTKKFKTAISAKFPVVESFSVQYSGEGYLRE